MRRPALLAAVFLALPLAAAVGCSGDDTDGTGSGGSSAGSGGGSGVGGTGGGGNSLCAATDPSLSGADPASLFAYDHIPVFEFKMPDDVWAALQVNARDEEYAIAEACYDGVSLGTVGLRFKGGFGTLQNCFDSSGQQTCKKLSMKVKFDEVTDDARFFKQEKLNFHSMEHEPSHLRERIAYELYALMGIVGPHSSWAELRINGEERGLFSMVEDVDEDFAENHLANDPEGDLYKEAWPQTTDVAYYAERAETDGDAAAHQPYADFAAALLAAADQPARAAVLAEWTDTEQLARYLAVDDVLINWDGITAFYANLDEGWQGNHNFYMFRAPDSGLFQLVPWDMDATLRFSAPMNHVPHWTMEPDGCPAYEQVFSDGQLVMPPGCDPLLNGLSSDLGAYQAALGELVDEHFTEERILAVIDDSAALLEGAVARDPYGPGLDAWRAALDSLRRDVPLLRARAESLSMGVVPIPFTLSSEGVSDFEDATEIELLLGATLMSAPETTLTMELERDGALEGAQSLRIDFEFRNGAEPWSQWVELLLQLDEERDLTALTGLRITARANAARTVRIDLMSPEHTRANEGIRFGWDVPLTANAEVFELLLADLALPVWATDDPADDVAAVLSSVTGMAINAQCQGRLDTGFLPDGTTDPGSFVVDSIEFY